MADIDKVYVYENWKDIVPGKIGTLFIDAGKGKEVISFEYDETSRSNSGKKRGKKTKTSDNN